MDIFDGYLERRTAALVLIAGVLIVAFFVLCMGDNIWVTTGGTR